MNNMNADYFYLDRSKPPVVGEARDFKFPEYRKEILPNGIKVYFIEDNKLPLVTAKFIVKAGAYNDVLFGEDKSGLASITSDLLVKGTKDMNAVKVAEVIDYYGATISSGCEYDASYLVLTSLERFFPKIFDIASDLMTKPAFLEEEIDREKKQISNSLLSYLDEGSYLSERVFKKNVYINSPYKYNIEGNIKTVDKLEQEKIREYYNRFFTPENLIISVVGDIKFDAAMSLIKSKFGNWNKKGEIYNNNFTESLNKGISTFAVSKKGAVQSDILIGHIGIKRNNPDYLQLLILNTMFGGFFTSRINKNLREVNGYTYGARSYFNFRKYLGDFCIETNVENSLTYKAIKEIILEMKRLIEESITDEELDSVKKYLTGSFPLQLETSNAIANKILNLDLYGIEENFYDNYISKINSITKEDVNEAAKKYIHPDNLVISIAGNTDVIKKDMEQISDVKVINNIEEL